MQAEPEVNSGKDRRTSVATAGVFLAALIVWTIYFCVNYDRPQSHSEVDQLSAPDIEVEAACLDFGEAWAQRDFHQPFRIINRSDDPVKILRMNASCGCTTIMPESPVTIPPRGVFQYDLSLNLTSRQSQDSTKPTERFNVRVWPTLSSQNNIVLAWNLKGVVKTAIFGLPPYVSTAEYRPGKDELPQSTIELTTIDEVATLRADVDSRIVRAKARVIEDAKHRFLVDVAFTQEPSPGPFKIPILITPVCSNGESLPTTQFTWIGSIQTDVFAVPGVINLGAIQIGETVEKTICICSHLDQVHQSTYSVSDPEAIDVSPVTDGSRDPKNYRIRVRASHSGQYQLSVRFEVTTKDERRCFVDVPVYYHGIGQSDWN